METKKELKNMISFASWECYLPTHHPSLMHSIESTQCTEWNNFFTGLYFSVKDETRFLQKELGLSSAKHHFSIYK